MSPETLLQEMSAPESDVLLPAYMDSVKEEKTGDVKDDPVSDECSSMSHQEALALVEHEILDLIRTDPLLQYLPPGVTLDELNSTEALEHGRAMRVLVRRADGESYSVVVEQRATVLDLKKALQRHVALKLKREGCERTISWRYVWKTYWLYHDSQKLTQDHKQLKDYGIRNNSEVTFVKKLRII